LGNGDGSFRAASDVATPAQPTVVTSRDLDGDGRWDLVIVLSSFTDNVMIGLANGDGTFRELQSFAMGRLPSRISKIEKFPS